MTPDEQADFDRELAAADRRLALLQEIVAARRDLESLQEMSPVELEIYVASLDIWRDGSDPQSRLIRLLRQAEDELKQ
jgi:hypothetical protein